MHDCVIRSGTIIDGTGSPRRCGDVAIDDGRISAVGEVSEQGRREIDASDLLVTPGWVDVHTHYDGQATWDSLLSPSCWHGVTTIVMGNCGVGFAPARPDRHDWLIGLMEGVEDIPGTALAEGIDWAWESFPEYLDALERRPHALDIGAQLPHGALRAYVMKERGAIHTEVPSQAEIAQMAQLAGEAMLAGALGFTTSRTTNHRTVDGEFTPSLTAGADELLGIARGIGAAGCGVLQAVADFRDLGTEFGLLRKMAEESGRPLSISLAQSDAAPDQWLQLLDLIGEATQQGLHLKAQVPVRAIGLMMGLQASLNPFSSHPSYRSIADLPLAEKLGRMRQPEFRKQLLAEKAPEQINFMLGNYERMFVLGDRPDYEPGPEKSIAAEARRRGIPAAEAVYERLLENEGKALLYRPLLNYTSHDLEVSRKMLLDPNTVPGLSDAGAHCGMISDGSFPTYLLSHWGKDRTRGEKLPVEWLVKRQTADTAALVGLDDRGTLAPGMRADLNLIDFDALAIGSPEIAFDLPTGGRRLIQRASGYAKTLLAGQVTFEDGESTGSLPGQLVRGAQPGPA
jgi:N-acyl-D-aspartate/D-glutamate deacylase